MLAKALVYTTIFYIVEVKNRLGSSLNLESVKKLTYFTTFFESGLSVLDPLSFE